MFGKKAYVVRTNNNRIEVESIYKMSEDNIFTKTSNYIVKPSHALVFYEKKVIWYFVNENSNGCYNPSTLKTDFDLQTKITDNLMELYEQLVTVVRMGEAKSKNNEEIGKELKKIVYEFRPQKRTPSDNINVTPSTQKSIMENEVAKGLSARAQVSKGFMLMLVIIGILPGVILGAWLAGDVYNQQKFNENYYPEAENETVVITAQVSILNGGVRSIDNPFTEPFNYIIINGKWLSV